MKRKLKQKRKEMQKRKLIAKDEGHGIGRAREDRRGRDRLKSK